MCGGGAPVQSPGIRTQVRWDGHVCWDILDIALVIIAVYCKSMRGAEKGLRSCNIRKLVASCFCNGCAQLFDSDSKKTDVAWTIYC